MSENPFDHTDIDEIIHGRLRLGAMAYLSTVSEASFNEIKAKVGASDGNLSTHLRKLEEAGYVRVTKAFAGRKPRTTVQLTEEGRAAWIAWIERMQAMIRAAD